MRVAGGGGEATYPMGNTRLGLGMGAVTKLGMGWEREGSIVLYYSTLVK